MEVAASFDPGGHEYLIRADLANLTRGTRVFSNAWTLDVITLKGTLEQSKVTVIQESR